MSLLQRMLSGYIPLAQLPNFDNTWPFASLAGGNQIYPLGLNQTNTFKVEQIVGSFESIVQQAYTRNAVVFAVELARISLFAQARFQFQRMANGRPGDYWGDKSLAILEHPWTGATTGDLLTRMMQDADFSGDAFVVRRGGKIRRLRPSWVTMMLGSESDPDVDGTDPFAEVIGLLFHPGGRVDRKPEVFLPGEFAHFAPVADPLGLQRGIPWVLPVIAEIMGDEAAVTHKLKFFENGATVNLVVDMDPALPREKYLEWVRLFEEGHRGAANAYRTLYMAGGAKATPIGSNMQEIDFSALQGRAEVRICIAGGVPPQVVGVSEGLQGSSLNEGNWSAAMRHFAGETMYAAWQNVAGSLETIVPSPSGSRLWYDARDIPALKDDIKDAATVLGQQSQSIRTLVDGGFIADTAVRAVVSGDLTLLEHTGLFPVQMQAPGAKGMPLGETPTELPEIGTTPDVPSEVPSADVPLGSKPPTNGKAPAKILAPLTTKKVAP